MNCPVDRTDGLPREADRPGAPGTTVGPLGRLKGHARTRVGG
ncbi:hypothetical protein ABH941_004806 [Streptacidiphilus sp. EB103A]